jgi:alpha-tubulin suppressor-like RCC1 family protein
MQMLLFCVILSVLATSTVALLSNIAGASVGVGHTCAFNTSGSAFCWGYNYYGQVLSCCDRSLRVLESCMHATK